MSGDARTASPQVLLIEQVVDMAAAWPWKEAGLRPRAICVTPKCRSSASEASGGGDSIHAEPRKKCCKGQVIASRPDHPVGNKIISPRVGIRQASPAVSVVEFYPVMAWSAGQLGTGAGTGIQRGIYCAIRAASHRTKISGVVATSSGPGHQVRLDRYPKSIPTIPIPGRSSTYSGVCVQHRVIGIRSSTLPPCLAQMPVEQEIENIGWRKPRRVIRVIVMNPK